MGYLNMIFRRKIYKKLLEWKNKDNGTKAVLIEGARRIGKSTIAEEFGKKNYKSYVVIDFSKVSPSIKDGFNNLLNDLDSLFMMISLEYNVTLYKRDSLLIFDEVQRFPRAREAIKHLVKDGRYDYIETGSLISIKENTKDILIPSEEKSILMYPMDFEEFAWALGEKKLIEHIKECFMEKKPLLEPIHKKAMFLFKQYLLVGGMPKVVKAFLDDNKQFNNCDEEKREILKTYRNDIMKIDQNYQSKVMSIFDRIPGFLSSHEKRVKINSIDTTKRGIAYEETFFWLADSMICNECFSCNDPNIGLSLTENNTFIKCYMNDTGLLFSHAFDEFPDIAKSIYVAILQDKLSINKGMLYENVIAQMLVSSGHKLYFYNKYNINSHRNDIEIDFLIITGDKTNIKISPIEVKSSKRYTTASLEKFSILFKNRISNSYIIHPKNLSIREDGIICIPPYMTFCL